MQGSAEEGYDEEAPLIAGSGRSSMPASKSTGKERRGASAPGEAPAVHIPEPEAEQEEKPAESALETIYPWAISVSWITLGMLGGTYFEGWSPITSAYVIVQVVTTVGYGDVTPTSHAAKIFCGVYVLVTIVFAATVVTECAVRVVAVGEDRLKKQLEVAQAHVLGIQKDETSARRTMAGTTSAIISVLYVVMFLVFGTVFYSSYEGCSCSYGRSRIEGCIEGASCSATGGAVKSWQDALYMSLITLTTVGFGDYSPQTKVGRLVGCVWMLLGVAAVGNMVAKIANARIVAARDRDRLHTVNRKLFCKLDLDNDGTLSRYEFRSFTLVKFGLVTQEDLDSIDHLFDSIDVDKSNELTYEEIERYHSCL